LRAERHSAPHPPDRPEQCGQQAVRPETPDEGPVQSALLACGPDLLLFCGLLTAFCIVLLAGSLAVCAQAPHRWPDERPNPLPLPHNPLIPCLEIDL
jgi:hypothetical protein